jgi:hypothetical protein
MPFTPMAKKAYLPKTNSDISIVFRTLESIKNERERYLKENEPKASMRVTMASIRVWLL